MQLCWVLLNLQTKVSRSSLLVEDKLEGQTLSQALQDSVMILSLKDIVPAPLNNIDTRFILLDKGKIAMEGQSKNCLALVADETAAVHFLLWGRGV